MDTLSELWASIRVGGKGWGWVGRGGGGGGWNATTGIHLTIAVILLYYKYIN